MPKITNLPAASALSGAELAPIVQDGDTKKASLQLLADFVAEVAAQPAAELAAPIAAEIVAAGLNAYIPVLSVTVGIGGDYETLDELVADVAPKSVGLLQITNVSDVLEFSGFAGLPVLSFPNATLFFWDLGGFTVTADLAGIIGSTLGFAFTGNGKFLSSSLSFRNMTSTSFAPVIEYEGSLYVDNLTGNNIAFRRATEDAGDNTLTLSNVKITRLVTNVTPRVDRGTNKIITVVLTNIDPLAYGVAVSGGASCNVVTGFNCGSGGVGVVYKVIEGGTIFAGTATVTGTYTDLYSQVPNVNTELGTIYAEFDKTQTDAATSGTVSIEAGKTRLKLTGALAATLTIDGTAIVDGSAVTVYSTNGITALTVTGGTVLGFMPGVGSGGIFTIERSGAELWVS